jgi:hypothetical protein
MELQLSRNESTGQFENITGAATLQVENGRGWHVCEHMCSSLQRLNENFLLISLQHLSDTFIQRNSTS